MACPMKLGGSGPLGKIGIAAIGVLQLVDCEDVSRSLLLQKSRRALRDGV